MSDWGFDRIGGRGSSGRPNSRGGRGARIHGNVHGFGNNRRDSPPRRQPTYDDDGQDDFGAPEEFRNVVNNPRRGNSGGYSSGPPPSQESSSCRRRQPPSYGSNDLASGGRQLGVHDDQSWNQILSNNGGRIPPTYRGNRQPQSSSGGDYQNSERPRSSGRGSRGPSGGQDSDYRPAFIINKVKLSKAFVRQIAEWFDEGMNCFEIMNMAAIQYHGIQQFQRGAFDPEIVVCALTMEKRLDVVKDDGSCYEFKCTPEIDRRYGIGEGFVLYEREERDQDGLPVLEFRMQLKKWARNGFFRGVMNFPDDDD